MQQPRSYYNAFGGTTDASMQQLQCDLLPHVAEHQGRTDSILKRPQPHPPHRRYLEIAGSSHITWKNTRFGAPASSPKQSPCNNHAAFTMRLAAPPIHIHADITMRFASTRCRTARENRFDPETTAAAPAAQRRNLSSPAAATLHGKTRFRAPASSPKQSPCNNHAAFTMRLAAPPIHIHADITMRFASTRCRTARENRFDPETTAAAPAAQRRNLSSPATATLHGKTRFRAPASSPKHTPCNMNAAITMRFAAPPTSMQTLQCDLHPHVAEHQGRTDSTPKIPETTAAALAALQRRTLIAGCSHFTRKNTTFRAPASSPKQSPCNNHAAITMRLAAPPTHPCSHYNAICTHTLQNTRGEPIRPRNDHSRTRRTQEVPFIAGCSHLTRKNTTFRAPASSPKHTPCNMNAAITMRFAASRV